MPYLDKEEKFYDYRTKEFNGSDPFDVTKTGVSFYNQFFTDPDYMEEYKNLKYKIVNMSPNEYFEECAEIFNSSKQSQIHQTGLDTKVLNHLKEVLLKYKKTFPITFLNYAEETQEGRHRMYIVGELLGWDKKFPVMIVEWADPVKEEQKRLAQLEDKKQTAIDYINKIANLLMVNEYDFIEELIENFKYYLEPKYSTVNINVNRDSITFDIDKGDVEYRVPIWDFKINEISSSNYEDEDFDYENMLLQLESYGLKNW